MAGVSASVNDSQKVKEYCEKALTISRGCGDRKFEAQLYLNLGRLFKSLGECGKAAEYLQKACSISSQIGLKMIEFESLLSITVLKISQSEAVEAKDYLLQCIGKYEQIRTLLKGNSGFQISLLEEHGTSPYKLLTHFLWCAGKFRLLSMLRSWDEQDSSQNSWQTSTPWKAIFQLIHDHGSGLKTS